MEEQFVSVYLPNGYLLSFLIRLGKESLGMISERITITNELGLHARPANIFVKEANKYESDIFLIKEGKKSNAKSMLAILSASVTCGAEIELVCEGSDEASALSGLIALLEAGLPE